MSYALTVKSQVTLPKAMRQHLGVKPGDAVDYEALPDGRVAIVAARAAGDAAAAGSGKAPTNRFARWAGKGIAGASTEQILRATRGKDALR
jgi:antitoxin PrlF